MIQIDPQKCIGCGRCAAICPGGLIRLTAQDGPQGPEQGEARIPRKAVIPRPADCWSCSSCLKECPVQAIALTLPPDLGGNGMTLTAVQRGTRTDWTFRDRTGMERTLTTDTGEANKY